MYPGSIQVSVVIPFQDERDNPWELNNTYKSRIVLPLRTSLWSLCMFAVLNVLNVLTVVTVFDVLNVMTVFTCIPRYLQLYHSRPFAFSLPVIHFPPRF